ncbi:MAG: hypothetical protein AAGB46_03915 [Verrucomicrobiota bacterium]
MGETQPQYPILILDASSKRCFVGIKTNPECLDYIASETEASQSIFISVKELLLRQSFGLSSIQSIIYCEGPGSMLGIRTVVMAIRAWKGAQIIPDAQIFCYDSLSLGSQLVETLPNAPADYLLITDARRSSWNALDSSRLANSHETEPSQPLLSIIENADLESIPGAIYTFPQFPSWTQTHVTLQKIDYHPESVFSKAIPQKISRLTDSPAPLSLRPSEYKKWAPKFTTQAASEQ